MHPRTPEWLREISCSGRYIQSRTIGKTRGDYLDDEDLRSVVERKFHVIGENPARIRDHDLPSPSKVSNAQQIIGLRNLLAHAYSDIDHDRIWTFIGDFLPFLIDDVDRLLDGDAA